MMHNKGIYSSVSIVNEAARGRPGGGPSEAVGRGGGVREICESEKKVRKKDNVQIMKSTKN